jgi:hypothetical protein
MYVSIFFWLQASERVLLVLDHPTQVWWRWMSVFFTLLLWGVELSVSEDNDVKEWKVE